MLGWVIIRYCKAPTLLWYSVESVSSSPLERDKVVPVTKWVVRVLTVCRWIYEEGHQHIFVTKEKTKWRANHLNAQKVMKFPIVFHGKLPWKNNNDGLDHGGWTACQDNIINIEQHDQDMRTSAKNKHQRINIAIYKSMRLKKTTEMMKLGPYELV